jgi:hypothetical protein
VAWTLMPSGGVNLPKCSKLTVKGVTFEVL